MAKKLPEKFENMSWEEIINIFQNPEKHPEITFGDMLTLTTIMCQLFDMVNFSQGNDYSDSNNEALEIKCRNLEEENETLKAENERLKKYIKVLIGINSADSEEEQ